MKITLQALAFMTAINTGNNATYLTLLSKYFNNKIIYLVLGKRQSLGVAELKRKQIHT